MSDGKAVGFCGCNRKSEFVCMGRSVPEGFYKASTEDTLVISDMVTAVEYRKRALDYAKKSGYSAVECYPSIEFSEKNVEIFCHLLEKAGFSEIYSSKECSVYRKDLS